AIAVDESFVYVIDGSGTWRIDKATGAAVTIDASKVNPAAGDTAIASAGGYLVIASGLQWAYRLPKDGGARAVLFDGGPGAAVRGLALDGNTAFFLVGAGAPTPGLYSVAISTGALTRVRTDPAATARSLTVTPTHFLWTEPTRVRIAPR